MARARPVYAVLTRVPSWLLLARSDTAKDVEILVLRTQRPSSIASRAEPRPDRMAGYRALRLNQHEGEAA